MVVVVGWAEHTPCSQEFEFSGLLTSAPAGSVFITAYSLLHRRATSTQPVNTNHRGVILAILLTKN